jgi:hypothetical protein
MSPLQPPHPLPQKKGFEEDLKNSEKKSPSKELQKQTNNYFNLAQDLEELPDLNEDEFSPSSLQAPARAEIVKKPANLPMIQVPVVL